MCLPVIGFSFWVIGHPTTGVIKKQLGEVDAQQQQQSRDWAVRCGQECKGIWIIEFSRIGAGGVKH